MTSSLLTLTRKSFTYYFYEIPDTTYFCILKFNDEIKKPEEFIFLKDFIVIDTNYFVVQYQNDKYSVFSLKSFPETNFKDLDSYFNFGEFLFGLKDNEIIFTILTDNLYLSNEVKKLDLSLTNVLEASSVVDCTENMILFKNNNTYFCFTTEEDNYLFNFQNKTLEVSKIQ